jgi:hypothetical protein
LGDVGDVRADSVHALGHQAMGIGIGIIVGDLAVARSTRERIEHARTNAVALLRVAEGGAATGAAGSACRDERVLAVAVRVTELVVAGLVVVKTARAAVFDADCAGTASVRCGTANAGGAPAICIVRAEGRAQGATVTTDYGNDRAGTSDVGPRYAFGVGTAVLYLRRVGAGTRVRGLRIHASSGHLTVADTLSAYGGWFGERGAGTIVAYIDAVTVRTLKLIARGGSARGARGSV